MLRDQEAFLNNCSIRGLWIDVDARGLIHMDGLEGFLGIEEINDYERVWVTDLEGRSRADGCRFGTLREIARQSKKIIGLYSLPAKQDLYKLPQPKRAVSFVKTYEEAALCLMEKLDPFQVKLMIRFYRDMLSVSTGTYLA